MAETWESVLRKMGRILQQNAADIRRLETDKLHMAQKLIEAEETVEALTLERDAMADFLRPVVQALWNAENSGDDVEVPMEYSADQIAEMKGMLDE